MKIIAEINVLENRNTIGKASETKNLFFKRDKIDRPLARLIIKKISTVRINIPVSEKYCTFHFL